MNYSSVLKFPFVGSSISTDWIYIVVMGTAMARIKTSDPWEMGLSPYVWVRLEVSI